MRLIRRVDRERLGISLKNIEAPFFAKFYVEKALHTPGESLCRFGIDSFGSPMSIQEIVDQVEDGDLLLVEDDPFSPLSDDTFNKYSHITGRGWSGAFHNPVQPEKPPLPDADPIIRPQPQEPGFYIVPKSTTREKLKAALFAAQNPAVMSKFESLNPNTGDVKAGAMIVLSDPNNLQCTREEAILMAAAAKTNDALEPLSPEDADFMVQYRDQIETFFGHGSTAIGVGEAMFAKHLDDVKNLFKEIEALHVRSFQADGHLNSQAFFAERKRLLRQLNTHLGALTRKSIGFPDHPNLKSALGISNKSLVHRWTQAGGADQIPGYATHIEGVSKASKYLKYGGWIGTAIGGGVSYMKVQDVCAAGDTEACKKVKFTEAGGFAGGIAGGALAGALMTAPGVAGACAAIGLASAGVGGIVCGIVVVGAGSLASGAVVGSIGEGVGEVIYEVSK